MSNARCFYPNGSPSLEEDIPCGTGDAVACCPLNWVCQANGLCYLKDQDYYGRYTCTDKNWGPGCPNICTYDKKASGNEAVLECTQGSYCCDTNRPELSGGTNCCKASPSRFSINGHDAEIPSNSKPPTPFSSSIQASTPKSSSFTETSTPTLILPSAGASEPIAPKISTVVETLSSAGTSEPTSPKISTVVKTLSSAEASEPTSPKVSTVVKTLSSAGVSEPISPKIFTVVETLSSAGASEPIPLRIFTVVKTLSSADASEPNSQKISTVVKTLTSAGASEAIPPDSPTNVDILSSAISLNTILPATGYTTVTLTPQSAFHAASSASLPSTPRTGSSVTPTSTELETPNPAATTSPSVIHSPKVIASVTVGGAVALILFLIFYLWLRRRQNQPTPSQPAPEPSGLYEPFTGGGHYGTTEPSTPNPSTQHFPIAPPPKNDERGLTNKHSGFDYGIVPDHDLENYRQPNLQHVPAFNPYETYTLAGEADAVGFGNQERRQKWSPAEIRQRTAENWQRISRPHGSEVRPG